MIAHSDLFTPAPPPLSVSVALEHQTRACDRRASERRRVARQALGDAAAVLIVLWAMFFLGIAVGRASVLWVAP